MKPERPIHHPDQVMSTKELKVGDKITWNNINLGSDKPETIISFCHYPFQGKLKKTFRTITENGIIKMRFFTDYGISPYPDGWNETNYTLKVKETKK